MKAAQNIRWARLGLAAAASLLLLAIGAVAVRTLVAERDLDTARQPQAAAAARVQQARALRPDLGEVWLASGRVEQLSAPAQALVSFERAIRLEPDNWRNWQAEALVELQLGDTAAALRDMDRASRLNSGFSAHFQYANLAWMLGDPTRFWTEMSRALAMAPADQMGPALREVQHLAGDQPQRMLSLVPPGRTELEIQLMDLFLASHQRGFAQQAWNRLSCPDARHPDCQQATLRLVSSWLAAAAAATSTRVPEVLANAPAQAAAASLAQAMADWNRGVHQGWLIAAPVREGAAADGRLQFPWLGGFAWTRGPVPLHLMATATLGNFASVNLNGDQGSPITFLSTWVPVHPGQSYRVSFQARNADAPLEKGGMELTLALPDGTPIWSLPVQLTGQWTRYQGVITAPAHQPLLQLAWVYQRPSGHDALRGDVEFTHLDMAPASAPALSNAAVPLR